MSYNYSHNDEGRPSFTNTISSTVCTPHYSQHSDQHDEINRDFETLLRSKLKAHEDQLANHRRLTAEQSIVRQTNITAISGREGPYIVSQSSTVPSGHINTTATDTHISRSIHKGPTESRPIISSSSRIGELLSGKKKDVPNKLSDSIHCNEAINAPRGAFQQALAILRSSRDSSTVTSTSANSDCGNPGEEMAVENTTGVSSEIQCLMTKPPTNSPPTNSMLHSDILVSYNINNTNANNMVSTGGNMATDNLDSDAETVPPPPHTATCVMETVSSHDPACYTGTPRISSVSRKLAMRARQESGVDGLDIGTSLLLRADQARADKWLRQQQMALEEVPGRPTISIRAKASQNKEGDNNRSCHRARSSANERLYELSKTAQKKKKLISVTAELKALIEANMDGYRPEITSRARDIRRKENHNCHEDLYIQAVECKKQREEDEIRRMREQDAIKRAQTPMVNPISRLIADNLCTTSKERLYENHHHGYGNTSSAGSTRTPRTSSVIPMTYDAEGHIVATPTAVKRGSNMNNGDRLSSRAGELKSYNSERIKALHDEHAKRLSRRTELTEKANAALPKECTFKPHLSTVSRQMTSSYIVSLNRNLSTTEGGADDVELKDSDRAFKNSTEVMPHLSIAERSELWTLRRETKLAKERQETEQSQMKECTFEPAINPPLESNLELSTDALPGYTGFLDRQQSARHIAEEKQHMENLVASGIGWGSHPPLHIGEKSVSIGRDSNSQPTPQWQPSNVLSSSSTNTGIRLTSRDISTTSSSNSISLPRPTASVGDVIETDVLQRAIQALHTAKEATSRSRLMNRALFNE